MSPDHLSGNRGRVIGLHERPLGRTVLRTYRTKLDLDDVMPNERQPRLGPKEDEELQRQIEANEGLFEPLLIEPHPDLKEKFRIIDGERRWTVRDSAKASTRADLVQALIEFALQSAMEPNPAVQQKRVAARQMRDPFFCPKAARLR